MFRVPSPSRDVHHGGAYMNTMPCGLMNSNAAPDKVGIFKDTRRERKAQYLPTFDPVCNRQDRKSSKYLSVATKKRTAKPTWAGDNRNRFISCTAVTLESAADTGK